MRTTQTLLILLLACCTALPAQQPVPAPKQTKQAAPVRAVRIRFAQGAGLCSCYCGSEIQVDPGKVTLLVRPFRECQQQNPQKYRELKAEATLSGKHWRELQQLADRDTLFALPDRIGCPGCTDGPIDFIEVEFSDQTKKSVTYESAPKEIQTLSEKLSALDLKLEDELPTWWRQY